MNIDVGDGAVMPKPNGDLEWKLRYGNPTKSDLLCAASILSAYQFLVFNVSQKEAGRRLGIVKRETS